MAVEIEGLAPLLFVFDMEQSLQFYRDGIGFEIIRRSEPESTFNWALLRLNSVELMLEANPPGQRPPAPDPVRVAAHCDTALYFGCKDLDGTYAGLQAKGLNPEAPFIQPYGMKQVYLRDPDGYMLCFQWPAHSGV